jgi:hypothetical protein
MIMSRMMVWVGHVACIKEKRNAYMILVGKPEGKRSLRRIRGRCEGHTEIYLREIGRGAMERTDLAQDRNQWRDLVNMVINFRVP